MLSQGVHSIFSCKEIRGTQGCALVADHGLRLVQGRSQGTTLSASDFHMARPTILKPFYDIECKMIKKIRQNKTWLEADIPCVNILPNRYNAFAPAVAYVSNNVVIPDNFMTSKMNTKATLRTLLQSHLYGTEIVLKSTDRLSNITLFLHVQWLNHRCLTVFISRQSD